MEVTLTRTSKSMDATERAHEVALLAAQAARAAASDKDLSPPEAAETVVTAYQAALKKLSSADA